MRHLIIAMLVLQSSVCASQSGSGTFRLWVTSDAHVAYDLDKNGRLSIADAIEQSEGKYEKSGYPAFDWDVMLHLGDIFGQYPDDPEGQLIVSQFNAGKSHSREQIYNIMGNHDASGVSQPENWVYRKWIDPMGNNEKYSGVDSNKRPYPVSGTYERYSFEVGNILFLMLSDRNDFDYAHGGRDTSILGYPAGKVTLETYLWWEEKVRNNQDK
ncbi:MAG: metallophosphoesterase, partial [Bacteroidetes bacterium]|nr:metallophosphoesterase [Bacteroidota bacterium]